MIKTETMKTQVEAIISQLLSHEITKKDAIDRLADILPIESLADDRLKKVLNSSVSALYFSDSSDYKSYHYQIVRIITGKIDISDSFIDNIFKQLNPE